MRGNPTDEEQHIASVLKKALGYSTVALGKDVDLIIKDNNDDSLPKSVYIDDECGPVTIYVQRPSKHEDFAWFKETLAKISNALHEAGIPCEEKPLKNGNGDMSVYSFELRKAAVKG